jgi:magnesium-protoporphyrin IX monomethyl ester (oxidative) cyclase
VKILLVFPPASIFRFNIKGASPPLGIGYIAAYLRERGYEVHLLDAIAEGFENEKREGPGTFRYGLSFQEIEDRIRLLRPDVVGISSMFSIQAHNAEEVARTAKRVDPRINTVMGGVHPTLFPRETLETPHVDFLVLGQGEETMLGLLEVLEGRRAPESLKGFGYRANGDIRIHEDHQPILDLDALPMPARDLLPMEKYFRINMPHGGVVWRKPVTTLVSSRGCTLACGFCNASVFWRNRIHYRSPENVVDEIQMLIDTYGIRELHFEDDNLLLSRKRALELFDRMAERRWDLVWNAPNGLAPWKLDDALIEAMRRSGCYEVPLAIESGSQEILDRVIGKPVRLDRMPGVVRKIQEEGMFAHSFLIVGFPGETKEQTEMTLRLPRQLGVDDTTFAMFVPLPRTRLREEAIRQGLLDPEHCGYKDFHMHATLMRTNTYSAEELMRMVARVNIRMKLRLLRRPVLFYRRYVRVLLRSPRFFFGYMWEWLQRLVPRGGRILRKAS